MSHPSLQVGSSQSQVLLRIKRLLTETRVCLDALDQSSLAGLRSDKEYKNAIGHLLSPLTAIPLSTVANKALTSGIEAVTAQLGGLLLSFDVGAAQDRKDAVDPPKTVGPASPDTAKPGKQRDPTSRYLTKVAFGSGTAPQPPAVPQLKQMTMEESSTLQKIQQNRRMMATIYFVEGGKKDSVTLPHLVEEMNKTLPFIEAGGVSCAWETVRGDIVIAFPVPRKDINQKALVSYTMLAPFDDLWTEGSSPYFRFGGDNPMYVMELEVVTGGKHQFDWPEVVKRMEQELVRMSRTSDTSISLSFLAGMKWSKKWMRFDGYGFNIQRFVAEEWPRNYKMLFQYLSIDVEIEISMNLLCIDDRFDFRA